ncbi:D-alanyl-D-alanine carboxypeptidase family protein [Leucobacter albus]|uniref:D-alanyl-D-alanine carboxypeptidase family protein n=1 Tax=Leucobacter albus TaxID=272210 RepID=A0ABW3TLB3_9MICO
MRDDLTPTATARPAPPAPRAQAPRRGRRGRVVAWLVPALLVLGAGGYAAAAAAAPLPAPTLRTTGEVDGERWADLAPAQAAVDAQQLPTAIGWLDGDAVWSNDDRAYPLASISKLITVLVCQEAQPLAPGDTGPVYTWTAADRERQNYYLSLDGVAYPIPVGTEVTLREMLTLIFLPSANDFAAAYAYSVFGDNDAFLAAVDDWADRHGLDSLEFVEPTGMDEGNVASPDDLIRIARLALNNPTIAEFTGTQSAVMPWGIGLIENTNPLLGEQPGMLGVKTGRSSSAGFNFIAAQESTAGGREVVKISVTLARPSIEARAQSGRDMLAAIEALPQRVPLVAAGEQFGELVGPDGASVPVVAADSAEATMLPGETAIRSAMLSQAPSQAPSRASTGRGDADAGADAGTLSIATPSGDIEVALRSEGTLPAPGLWWRLTHPAELFGW